MIPQAVIFIVLAVSRTCHNHSTIFRPSRPCVFHDPCTRSYLTPHSSVTFHSNSSATTMALFNPRDPRANSRRDTQSTSASWNIHAGQRTSHDQQDEPSPEAQSRHGMNADPGGPAKADRRRDNRTSYFPSLKSTLSKHSLSREKTSSYSSLRTTIIRRRRRSFSD